MLHPQSFGRLDHAPRRLGYSGAAALFGFQRYFTTILTSLSGTTITFTTCLPSNNDWTLVSVKRELFERLARRSERDIDAPAQVCR